MGWKPKYFRKRSSKKGNYLKSRNRENVEIQKRDAKKPSGIERDVLLVMPKKGTSLKFRDKKLPLIVRSYFENHFPEDYKKLRTCAARVSDDLGVSMGVVMSVYCRIRKLEQEYTKEELKKEADSLVKMLTEKNRKLDN